MNKPILVLVLLLVGGLAGWALSSSDSIGGRHGRTHTVAVKEMERVRVEDRAEIERLRAEIARLEDLLAAARAAGEGDGVEVPYADDTIEKVEKLLQDAYAENNVDWLIEVIERLLRMGERGYPTLRRLLEDIVFRAKFLPAQSDFRIDQLYKVGRVFANLEPQFIGFLNYLLLEKSAHPWFKQGAMMGAAFYVGSNAKGSEELKQTMMQLFLQDQGGMIPGVPKQIGQRMNIFAMAMSGDPQMIGPLRNELGKTDDKEMQSDIIGALAYLGDPGAVPLVQERLDPREGDFRKEIRALGRVGTDEAHATATSFLRSIPDSQRFYRHAREYMRNGGGSSAVLMIKERFESDPGDKEIGSAIGSLRRFPTAESLDTLNAIAAQAPDKDIQTRAAEAAEDVGRRLRGELPAVTPK